MLIHRQLLKRNLHFIAEETPEFLDGIALEFKGMQETLYLFIVGHWSFNRCRFGSVFVILTNGADNIIPIAVNGMEKVFFLLNMRAFQNFQIKVVGILEFFCWIIWRRTASSQSFIFLICIVAMPST